MRVQQKIPVQSPEKTKERNITMFEQHSPQPDSDSSMVTIYNEQSGKNGKVTINILTFYLKTFNKISL